VSSSLRRGALAAAAIALPLASLAACGAGNDAQTLQVKPDSAATTVGDIEIQNAVVLTKGGADTAMVSARVFNNGSVKQSLESLTVGSQQAKLLAADGGQTLIVPAGGSILIGGKDNPSATVPNSSEAAEDGDFLKVTFTFSDTGAVSVPAHVQPAGGYLSPYGPSATPSSAAASPKQSASPKRASAG
jgi:hypothetical protein